MVIKKSYFHIREFVTMYINKKVLKNTSLLVDRLEDDPAKWAFNCDIKEYYKNFLNDLSIEIFDFIREDNELKQIVEQLNNLCM